ncbi:tail fiber domain-containing protein [Geminicoccus harenae]|uniref:tail fiber domain-containing protein n=1 Tax=Geminicoccus harenae TaxID=2498453 RepID=UPI00168AC4A4|nr:tail fiber domain-containing protein [Geminicoccus harenae]
MTKLIGSIFGSEKAPKAPSTAETMDLVKQQGVENRNTAKLNQRMNMVNRSGPFGSVTYTAGPNDRWSQNVGFDPVIQSMVDRSVAGSNLSTAGLPALNLPGIQNTSDVEDALYRRGLSRLEPELDRNRNRTDSMLAARGITSGSAASTKAYDDLARRETDALGSLRDSAILGAGQEQSRLYGLAADRAGRAAANRGQLFGENLTLAQLPLQTAGGLIGLGNALMNGSQPAQVGVAGTDLVGAQQNAYQNRLAASQVNANNDQQMWGNIAQIGSAAIMSDATVKTDKRPVDVAAILAAVSGLPVERWRYLPGVADGGEHIGPYAQDVQAAFGVGDGKTLSPVDLFGILFASVQALTAEVAALKAEREAR